MNNQICANCRYWSGSTVSGSCRRRAPIAGTADDYLAEIAIATKLLLWWAMREWSDEKTADQQMDDFMIKNIGSVFRCTSWPQTHPEDWCGEWEARPNQEQIAA